MKTFRELLITQRATHSDKGMNESTLRFLQDSHNLSLLKHFIIPQIRTYILAITPSRRDPQELLFTFSNYGACVEFNKFHAKTLLHTMQNNRALRQKIPQLSYTKVRGYVPKRYLNPSPTQQVNVADLCVRAQGNFINHATNPNIHAIFEDIRSIIALHHKHSRNLIL